MTLQWYQTAYETIVTLYREELGRDPDPSGLMHLLWNARENGWTAETMRDFLHTSDEGQAYRTKPPAPTFPAPPTRDRLLRGQLSAQGVYIETTRFGRMPWWHGCWPWLDHATKVEVAQHLQALGDTIMMIGWPDGGVLYNEPHNFYSPPSNDNPTSPFGPLALTLPQVGELIIETLELGFEGVWFFLAGDDAHSGYLKACAQIQQVAPYFASHPRGNLNDYTVYVPGWDGVWHKPLPGVGTGYSPEEIQDWAAKARAAGAKYLGIEQGTGYMMLGEGDADYRPGGRMTGYDLILGEFNGGEFETGDVWQILARYLGPDYRRPPEQNAHDHPGDPLYAEAHDPSPIWVLRSPSPRGPYVYRVFEYGMYQWVRGTPAEVIQAWRQKFIAMGARDVC